MTRPDARPQGGPNGFTLLEMLLSLAIASLAVATLAGCFSFSLRLWERERQRPEDRLAGLLTLIQKQIGNHCMLAPEKSFHRVMAIRGDGRSLSLAVAGSVMSLHSGGPVLARHVFVPGEGEKGLAYYAEQPLYFNDLHEMTRFLIAAPGPDRPEAEFHSLELARLEFAYLADGETDLLPAWDNPAEPPQAIVITARLDQRSQTVRRVACPGYARLQPGVRR